MNFMSELDERMVRHADGGPDYDHYRTRAKRLRDSASKEFYIGLIAALRRRFGGSRNERALEADWQTGQAKP